MPIRQHLYIKVFVESVTSLVAKVSSEEEEEEEEEEEMRRREGEQIKDGGIFLLRI